MWILQHFAFGRIADFLLAKIVSECDWAEINKKKETKQ